MISRSNFRQTAIALLFVLFLGCGPRQTIVSPDSRIRIDPQIVYGVLPNGFQYILKNNTTPKDRVSIHLDVFAGSLNETQEEQGLAHYLEHMLFNGSENFKPGELIEYFQSIGMDFGGDANAHTGFFNTVYDLSLPKADTSQLDKALLIIKDYAKGALLMEQEVDRERGIILAEKRERDSVSYRTYKKSLEFELPGSLLNSRWPIGIESVIKTADNTLLKNYYDKWYRPDNMALIMVGDFDSSITEQLIVKQFSQLKPRTDFEIKTPEFNWVKHKGVKAFYHHEPESGSTDVTIEALTWEPFKYQTIDTLKRSALTAMANSMVQNRINRMVSQQSVDFLHGAVYAGSYLHHINMAAISATCEPDKWEPALRQIEQVLRQALEYGFSAKELARVKAEFISALEQADSLSSSRKSEKIAKQILSTINQRKLLLSDNQKKKILKPYLKSISLEQAHHAFKKAWNKEHRLILVTGNAAISSSTPERTILEQYKKSNNTQTVRYKNFKSKQFPYLKLPEKKYGIRKEDNEAKDLKITTIEYENNIRLNLKKTNFKPNEFTFKVCFGKGKRSEPHSMQGLAYMAEYVLQQSGFNTLDSDQLEEALAGKKIRSGFAIQDNSIVYRGSASSKEVLLVLQLIYHAINDPGFRQKELDLFKVRYKQEYEGMLRTVDGIMQIKGVPFLANNDVRFRVATPEEMNRYTIKDIWNWLQKDFQNSPLEISIVGDFDENEVVDAAAEYIGSFKKRDKFPIEWEEGEKVSFPHGRNTEFKVDTKIENSVIYVAFKTDDFWDIKQTRRLSILSRVLSERLRIQIREELGEAYSPYVFNQSSRVFKGYGIMQAVVKVKPGNQKKVYEKIKDIADSIIKKGISKKETKNALQPVVNHIKDLRKTNSYWLNSVLSYSSNYPVKYEWARSIVDDYKSITALELEMLAKKYLKFEDSASVYIKP